MKKRKELNALIGLSGESRRKKPKKGSGHRLLRTEPPASDSESSSEEEEEFGVVGSRSRFVKRTVELTDLNKIICYSDFNTFLKNSEPIVLHFNKFSKTLVRKGVESNQKSSFQEIPKLNEELLSKQRELEKIESGELGLNKVWINITEMNKQISLLNSAVNHLKANVKSAADLISLPATVEGLQKWGPSAWPAGISEPPRCRSPALPTSSSGSTVRIDPAQHEVVQEAAGSACATATHPNPNAPAAAAALSVFPLVSVASIGNTLNSVHLAVEAIQKTVDEHKKAMELLQSDLIGDRAATLKRESLHQVTSRVDAVKTQSIKKEDSSDSQVSKLREKLQLISALSNKPESNRPPETTHEEQVQSFTSKPSAFPEFPQSPGGDIEKTAQLRSISLPGIASIKDLEDLFYKTGQNMDEKLTYQEIWNSLGSAMPAPESLREFDADGDGRYSFLELRAAVGV
ncbi:EF-hand domain-containing protein KIAA0494 [Myotis davidii]|uniref:EF-hand domain-containing protein KIAA0494 n=1 Tax=Myotis davidii TaxID=225400 RepID=L5LXF0_MYODS|nr:EF-hand domain-containing protein KIAA0494 [Myotis davidii]